MSRDQKPTSAGERRPSVDPRAERLEAPVGQLFSLERRDETLIVEEVGRRGTSLSADAKSNVVILFPGVGRLAQIREIGAPRRIGGVRSDAVK